MFKVYVKFILENNLKINRLILNFIKYEEI